VRDPRRGRSGRRSAGIGELTSIPERHTELGESEADRIVEGALSVLEETGFVYAYEPALHAVESAGCLVDHATRRARIPRALVEDALRLTPGAFVHPGRTRGDDVLLDTGHTAFTVSGGGTLMDRVTGRQRPAVLGDVAELVTFIDHVAGIDVLNSPLAVADCPRELTGEFILAEVLKYGRKPVVGCGPIGVGVDKRVQLELADAAGRPIMNAIGPVSPLSLPDNMCEALMLWAERRWPCLCWSGPTPGANGPATLAGTLVVALAEIMAAIVLAQTVGPGTPIIAGYSAMLMDMRSGSVYTGVEGVLLCNAGAQLLHRYDVPFWSACPMVTGNTAGWQNGMQTGMQAPLLAVGGGNIVSFSGGLSMDCVYAYPQLLLADELIATTKRYLRGVRVDDRSLALDLIRTVGPAPSDYLGAQHTREEYREEIHLPLLLNTAPYGAWEAQGARDAVQRAADRAAVLWETEIAPDRLPDDVCRELDAIVRTAVERL
jgi:trimethylamine--corrinoid protein Co-methyltransferase